MTYRVKLKTGVVFDISVQNPFDLFEEHLDGKMLSFNRDRKIFVATDAILSIIELETLMTCKGGE